MKFSTYEPVVGRNTINPPAVQASRDVMAYGTDGKEWDGLQAGLGQVIKVAQQQQDEDDYIALSKAKNEIRERLVSGIYGEGGLFEQGVGENAAGLTQRVEDFNKQTYQEVGSQYNGRVQRALLKDFNENTMNLQRISASKEFSARQQLMDDNYASNLDGTVQMASLGAGDAQTFALCNGNLERTVYAQAKAKGWSGTQTVAELRKAKTAMVAGVVQALIADDRMDDAMSVLAENKGNIDQKVYTQLYGGLRKDQKAKDDLTFVNSFMKADGTFDEAGARAAAESKWGKNAQRFVSGGVISFTGDSGLDGEIRAAAQANEVDPRLLAAMANAESGFDQSVVSPAGALGVMQLMPDTAAGLGVDPNDRAQNIMGGAKYLKQMLDRYHGNVELAVAAYNAGPGNVGKDETDGHIPQNGETPGYVQRVMEYYNAHKNDKPQGFDMMGGTYYTVSPGAEAQVEGLNGNTWQKLQAISYAYQQTFGEQLFVTSGAESGGHNDGSKHYRGIAFDVAMDSLRDHPERRKWMMENAPKYGLIPLDEYDEGGYEGYQPYTGYKSGENFHFSDDETPFDASAVASAGGGGGHYESAYDPVQLEKINKMIDAKVAAAKSAQQAKEDEYTNIIIQQIRDAGDGAAAVNILESHHDDLSPSGYAKAKNAVSMYYAGAISSARDVSAPRSQRGNSNDASESGGKMSASTLTSLSEVETRLGKMRNSIGTVEEPGDNITDEDNHDYRDGRDWVKDKLETLHNKYIITGGRDGISDEIYWDYMKRLEDLADWRTYVDESYNG